MFLFEAYKTKRKLYLIKRLPIFALSMICGCKGYEAPLVNQSKSQILNPPIIIDGSASDRELRALRVRPRIEVSAKSGGTKLRQGAVLCCAVLCTTSVHPDPKPPGFCGC